MSQELGGGVRGEAPAAPGGQLREQQGTRTRRPWQLSQGTTHGTYSLTSVYLHTGYDVTMDVFVFVNVWCKTLQ